MSTPQDDLPTTVIPQQTVEQPAVTTAPATRRSRVWHRRIPARIGRARTSTVIIGCLFVLLGGLNFVLPQEDPFVVVPTSDGGTVRVRESQYTPPPTVPSTTAPAPTSEAPSGTTPAPTSTRAPGTTTGAEETEESTTAPTTPRTTAPSTSSSTRTTTSRAPSTTATPEETEEEPAPEETAEPTD
jgi:hypothetical protein